MALDPDRYVIGDDGLWVEKVGPWATESSTSSATTSGSPRPPGACTARTGRSSSTSSPARAGPIVRDDGSFIDGSPVVAFEQAVKSNAPFTSVEISDLESELLAAAATRLERRKAPVRTTEGPAMEAIKDIVSRLNPHGLHFALLDPHNLGALSFSIIQELAKLKRVDIMVHVSVSDLQRNARLYSSDEQEQFDEFAPGWRDKVPLDRNLQSLPAGIVDHWSDLVEGLGLPRARHTR
jgi:three-Cys-motif partner protein